MNDQALNEVARRLAAAYISYIAGHKGVDQILEQTPEEIGTFWKEVARQIFAVHSGESSLDAEARDAIIN